MRVYIDKENLLSLLSSSKDPRYEDCIRMLQKQCDVFFNFSKEEIIKHPISEIDSINQEKLHAFVTDLGDGKWKKWQRLKDNEDPFPSRPLRTDIYSGNQNDMMAVYLLNDNKTEAFQREGCLLIYPIGAELDALGNMILDDDYGFSKPIYIRDLQNWDETNTYLSPCTDIIIVDRYIFNADETILQYNVYSLIAQLSHKARQRKINICIVTDKERRDEVVDWKSILSKVKDVVKRKTRAEPNVTIVKMPKDLPRELHEHDRTIFTNYKYIYSGDTLLYFGSKMDNGRTSIISSGRLLTLLSFGKEDNFSLGMTFINDIQKLVDEVKKISPYFIEGDKKSNFINFS